MKTISVLAGLLLLGAASAYAQGPRDQIETQRLRVRTDETRLEGRDGKAPPVMGRSLVSRVFRNGIWRNMVQPATCNRDDVEYSAVGLLPNDVLHLPAGECHWSANLTMSLPAGVIVEGSGSEYAVGSEVVDGVRQPTKKTTGTDKTVIVDDVPGRDWVWAFGISPEGNTIQDFTIRAGTGLRKEHGFLMFNGLSTKLRATRLKLDNTMASVESGGRAMRFFGCLSGVVDHIIIRGGFQFDTWRGGCGPIPDQTYDGDFEWSEDPGFGGPNFLFLEDSSFETASNDCYHGGKWVIRYTWLLNNGVQTHPTTTGSGRGCFAWELYNNVFENTNPEGHYQAFNWFFLSSGSGVIHHNVGMGNGYSNGITLHSMRYDASTYHQGAPPQGPGYCTTHMTGVVSYADRNPTPDYPFTDCWDQPGMGQQDLITGYYNADPALSKINSVTKCNITQPCFYPNQKIEPIYLWGNQFKHAVGWGGAWIANYNADLIRDGTHYKDNTPRPGYTPYAYPHPLVTGTEPPTPTIPQAPTALVAQAVTETSAVLAWTDNASNEEKFWIESCQGMNCSNFMPIGSLAANVVTFTDMGLMPGTLYRYRVFASNPAGNSSPTNVIDVTTLAPPVTNLPPEITQLQLKNGSNVLDPAQPIMIKNVTIATAARDDAGVVYLEISVRLKTDGPQMLKSSIPTANPTTMTVTWNTNPYRGKGPVVVEVLARDAEGRETRRSIEATVQK